MINEAKTVPHFDGQTGWDCKQWLLTMEHTCNNVDLSDNQILNVFKVYLRGVALLWWNNLNKEPKGSHLWRKLLYSFLSAGGAKLEIAALFKSRAFQAYLGTDDGAN